jgi:glutamate---cysteine ligase / carboxylate-amine ligase
VASPSYAFGRALTLGVEEELLLVDAHTFALASGVSRILPERTERLKTELFECVVETTTPVCDSAEEALHELVGLRREVVARCERHGLRIHAAGLHPFSRGADQEIVPEPRYLKMKREIGPEIYRQVVAGLHVHVGMPDEESCLRAQEGVLAWLPEVLSLSANSPYRDGEETGLRSRRAGRLAELPRAGAPPVFASWADWEAFMHGRDYTRMWWDLRPHPRLGTLEVRIADQPTDVRRSAELAAVVQALAAEALDSRPETVDRERYEERRQEGAVRALPLDGLRAAIEPAARRLGTADLVRDLLDAPREAELQLAVGRARGVHAVAADIADRSLESL